MSEFTQAIYNNLHSHVEEAFELNYTREEAEEYARSAYIDDDDMLEEILSEFYE